ncbi:MAG: helix-turn-helix transcriptional regulator [bacterium]|nr:helix-turn-helix transcriptional regulator [bacterium]
MYDSKAIARRVKEAREARNLSQGEVGDKIGLSEAGFGHYERARQTFTVQQLFELERVLGRSVAWFLGIPTRPDELTHDEQYALSIYRRAKELHRESIAVAVLEGVIAEA